jgi:hypothetical protein
MLTRVVPQTRFAGRHEVIHCTGDVDCVDFSAGEGIDITVTVTFTITQCTQAACCGRTFAWRGGETRLPRKVCYILHVEVSNEGGKRRKIERRKYGPDRPTGHDTHKNKTYSRSIHQKFPCDTPPFCFAACNSASAAAIASLSSSNFWSSTFFAASAAAVAASAATRAFWTRRSAASCVIFAFRSGSGLFGTHTRTHKKKKSALARGR